MGALRSLALQASITQLILVISLTGLSFSNLKGFCYSYAWLCSLCEEGLPFAQELSLENSEDCYLCF